MSKKEIPPIPIPKLNPTTINNYIGDYINEYFNDIMQLFALNIHRKRFEANIYSTGIKVFDEIYYNGSGYVKIVQVSFYSISLEDGNELGGNAEVIGYVNSSLSGLTDDISNGYWDLIGGINPNDIVVNSQAGFLSSLHQLTLIVPNGYYYSFRNNVSGDCGNVLLGWVETKIGGGWLYDIIAEVSGGNGDVSLDDSNYDETVYGEAEYEQEFTLYIQPDSGYHLLSVTVDGVDKTSEVSGGELAITMPEETCDIVVTFEAD